MNRLEEIKARESKTTKEDWRYDERGISVRACDDQMTICDIRGWGHLTGQGHGALKLSDEDGKEQQDNNGLFIAHSRQDISWLITEVERLKEFEDWVVKRDAQLKTSLNWEEE